MKSFKKLVEKWFNKSSSAYDLCCSCKWNGSCDWSIANSVEYRNECLCYVPRIINDYYG